MRSSYSVAVFLPSRFARGLLFLLLVLSPSVTQGQAFPPPLQQPPINDPNPLVDVDEPQGLAENLTSPEGLSSTLQIVLMLTVLSLAPSILIMTTCFIRFVVVLGLLRLALGTQQLPPNQVLVSLSMFLTFLVMAPVWERAYEQGIRPYTNPAIEEARPDLETTFTRTTQPLRRFMSEQIERTGNSDTVWMFLEYQRPAEGTPEAETWEPPETYDDISLSVLLPAYMLSELKTAFVIGFQIYLPFVIIDMVVASILMSLGMMMVAPTLVATPFKLLLFVMVDGWLLTVGMLLESIAT